MSRLQKMIISLMIEGISIKQISENAKVPEGLLREHLIYPVTPFPEIYIDRIIKFYYSKSCKGVH